MPTSKTSWEEMISLTQLLFFLPLIYRRTVRIAVKLDLNTLDGLVTATHNTTPTPLARCHSITEYLRTAVAGSARQLTFPPLPFPFPHRIYGIVNISRDNRRKQKSPLFDRGLPPSYATLAPTTCTHDLQSRPRSTTCENPHPPSISYKWTVLTRSIVIDIELRR